MAESTPIEWTDRTWSPWEGCTRVSTAATGGGGCDHCYAERMNRWLHKGENWGPGAPRLEFSDAHWEKLNRWNDAAAKRGDAPKVFPSMCDPLDNEVSAGLRDRFWRAIENTPSLTWLVLTKRIGNAQAMLPQAWLKNGWPKNLWFGATVVNQREANRDIPKLLRVPARVRFLSIEPMLGPVDLTRVMRTLDSDWTYCDDVLSGFSANKCGGHTSPTNAVQWVICGGESGPGARPMHPDWARSLRDQCTAAGVPFMFKQHGEWAPGSGDFGGGRFKTSAISSNGTAVPGGYDAAAYPHGSESRDGWSMVHWAGKKAAGRLLDGVEHNGFPQASEA